MQSKEHHEGYLVYKDDTVKRPLVVVVHDWSGLTSFAKEKARLLAEMGYAGFAVDMYGDRKIGQTKEEKTALMSPFMENRTLITERLNVAIDSVASLPFVDETRIAAIGFCFGGLCVLDLARTGKALKGVVSFHGLLFRPDMPIKPIKASVLALHGYADPMVPPEALLAFCDEMTEANADWQVHQYGNVMHGFTNPEAKDPSFGTVYHPKAEARSLAAMKAFLEEVL